MTKETYFPEAKYLKRVQESSFLEKFKKDYFAQNWYAAFCNNGFSVDDEYVYAVSWRSAGADVADIRHALGFKENYLDWYCSGMGIGNNSNYVPEAHITDEVRDHLKEIGFEIIPDYYDNLGAVGG